MASSELNDKRQQALHLTRRATHKISRLRTKADVEVAGTNYDPRVSPKAIRRYNGKQLDAYIARNTQFVDRSTQFVGDIHRHPIPSSEWKDYKRAENARRKKVAEQFNKVKDVKLPGADNKPGHETIGQRRDKMRADRKLAGNPSVHDPYTVKDRKPSDVTSRKALKELLKDEKRKLSKGWENKELKRQIGEFSKMVDRIGDAELADKVAKLSAHQFRSLWNDTGFATAVSSQYELYRDELISEEDKPWHIQIINDAFTDARRLVDWAANLNFDNDGNLIPATPAKKAQRKKK